MCIMPLNALNAKENIRVFHGIILSMFQSEVFEQSRG